MGGLAHIKGLSAKGDNMKPLIIGEKCGSGHHVITEDNLGTKKDGRRYCKTCKRDRERGYYGTKPRIPYAIGGQCRKNHLLTEETTYRDHKGHLACKTCRQMRAQRYYRDNREALILYANKRAPNLTAARALLAA